MSDLIKSKVKLSGDAVASLEKGELVKLDMSQSVYVGIDISSVYYDVSLNGGQVYRLSYTPAGYECLNWSLSGCDKSQVWILMEVTGGYHYKLAHYLREQGYQVCVVNAYHSRSYGRSQHQRAKTDVQDARMLEAYAKDLGSKGKLRLWELSSADELRIKRLSDMLDKQEQRLREDSQQLSSWKLHPHSEATLTWLEQEISRLQQSIRKLEADLEQALSTHQNEIDLLISIPGIGRKTAIAIILLLGLGKQFDSAKAMCSYIGLDPSVFISGTSVKGKGKIVKLGCKKMRKLLYLCALSAKRCNPVCMDFYQKLLQKGKAKKTALIAVANKLVKQIFAILKSKQPFVVKNI
jgi:transposase